MEVNVDLPWRTNMANEIQRSSLDAHSLNPAHLWPVLAGLVLDDEDAFHLEQEIEHGDDAQ